MSAAVCNGKKIEEFDETTKTPEENASSELAVKTDPESVIKHPLNNCWCLWYFINDKSLKWEQNQIKVASFSTVEDFWALFNHIECASKLKMGTDYSLFKEGIKPMWEDGANVNGGRWSVALTRAQRNSDLDNLWMETIMMVVGENLDSGVGTEICGAVVSLRPRGDRLSLWTATHNNKELTLQVGHYLKTTLNIPAQHNIEFNLHSDTSNKRSSTVRALYTV